MKIGQSRKSSLLETVVSTVIGFVVAILSQYIIFPFFGLEVSLNSHLIMGAFFTVVSIIRSYFIRRIFNWWLVNEQ